MTQGTAQYIVARNINRHEKNGKSMSDMYWINKNEPLIPNEFPSRPWEHVAIDLFKLEGKQFVCLKDCFSCYFEIATPKNLSILEVIEKGIIFNLKEAVLTIIRGNGSAEAATEIAKCIFRKNKVVLYLALLAYRN